MNLFGLIKRKRPTPAAPQYIVLLHAAHGLTFINTAREKGVAYKDVGYTYQYSIRHREGPADVFMVNAVPGPLVFDHEVETLP